MLLITDTYLSSVPFGGKVIKNNNENPSKHDQKGAQGTTKAPLPELRIATGNRGLITVRDIRLIAS